MVCCVEHQFRYFWGRADTFNMGMEPVQDVDEEVIASVTPFEWFLFGGAVRRNLRNRQSRYYTLLPKYGKTKSVRVIVGSLWILPGFLFLVPAVILNVVSDAHSPVRTASYILLALALLCGALMMLRAFSARANST
jgi:hypothetical protein